MFYKKLLCVVLVLAGLAGCEVSVSGVGEDSPSEMMSVLLKNADAGDAEAQLKLGVLYYTGCGVKQDTYLAIHLIKMAAAQCNIDALFTLKAIYIKEYWRDDLGMSFHSRYTGKDFAEGSPLRAQADQGDSYAQLFLAMLANGAEIVPNQPGFASLSWRSHSFNYEVEKELGKIGEVSL